MGIHHVPTDDHEFDDVVRHENRKLESRSESAMPCRSYPLKTNPENNGFEIGGKLIANKWVGIQRKVSQDRVETEQQNEA